MNDPTPQDRPTPETDAAQREQWSNRFAADNTIRAALGKPIIATPWDFARTLERQRDTALARVAELEAGVREFLDTKPTANGSEFIRLEALLPPES